MNCTAQYICLESLIKGAKCEKRCVLLGEMHSDTSDEAKLSGA